RNATTGITTCCARAASGQAAAAPPSNVMNSRRFTASASRVSDRKDSTPGGRLVGPAVLRPRQPSKLARGARPSMNFRPLWLDRNRNVENLVTIIIFDHPPSTAGEEMIVDLESWEAGYDDALRGRPSQCTPSLDRFSYSSGYFQARAYRKGTHEAPRYARPSTQRAARRHGGISRLIII